MSASAAENYSWNLGNDVWVLNMCFFPGSYNSFAASTSSGSINVYDFVKKNRMPQISIAKAHELSVNRMTLVAESSLASVSTDGVKIWDLRTSTKPVLEFTNAKRLNFLLVSYDSASNVVAGGTELVGLDAELHLWDLRDPSKVVRSFVDSHHDDITDIKFHPTNSRYLMSGSTDGYVNVYDLQEPDEDEALHQVINFASVHSCHFVSPTRISVLSHMETLAFYELNNTNYEQIEEPAPRELGDVCSVWPDCEYVVDLNPTNGFVTFGANSKLVLSMAPFNTSAETFDLANRIVFPGSHGEEVVRDILVVPGTNCVLTCGEDGFIREWQTPFPIGQETKVEEKKEKKEKKDKKDKKDKKEKKDKKDKKDRKEKKAKKEKKEKKKEARFKPY